MVANMERIVVVSSNNNKDYLFYAPYICKAWNTLGWKVAIIVTHDVDVKLLDNCNSGDNYIIQLPEIKGLRMETVAQASRLYAANYLPKDALIMTSDMDLLPLQNYWNPDVNDITVYGHDLTWFSYFPMGYIAMSGYNWAKYMNLTMNTAGDMERDGAIYKDMTTSDNWEQWWNYDWQMITDRLTPHKSNIKFVNRGQVDIAGATLAKGRVDRYNWKETMKQDNLIDAHCHNNNVLHPDKLNDFEMVFEKVYGKL
jgi:hypothetical protein